jgi:hypothetical protein
MESLINLLSRMVMSLSQTDIVENAPIAEPVVKPKRQYNRRKPLNK